MYPVNLFLQVSTTNRDLQQDIADKEFREDLFYRLHVFPIGLPSLAAAAYDIPIPVHHFVGKHSARIGESTLTPSPTTLWLSFRVELAWKHSRA